VAWLLPGLLLALACARPPGVADSSAPLEPGAIRSATCVPDFPYEQGWLGGDAAYSIALPPSPTGEDRRTLWLFGDSFVGEPGQRNRVGATFVHNTIGISHCGAQGFEIDYAWGEDAEGEPRAFFDSGSEERYWWLFDGFAYDEKLYVGLLEIGPAEPDDVLQLPFRVLGLRLARIDNPRDDPARWRFETSLLTRSEAASPGAAMAVVGEYVYLYAFTPLREGRQPRFLTRIALDQLDHFPSDLAPALETFVEGGHWQPGFLPERAAILMADNASEMSVEYHPALGRWIAVYGAPVQTRDDGAPARADAAPSDRVFVRSASRLEGPWSERILLFRIPELSAANGGPADPNTVCYAAKGHGEFAPPGALLVTYVCNLRTLEGESPWPVLERLAQDMRLYRPRVVVRSIPPELGAP
jgi:hypothetical protein